MLKIKLARFGQKHQPHFRIVVNEARDKRDGKYTALLGHYTPVAPKELEIDVKAYEAWLKKGAKPTDTVAALFKRFQSGNPFPAKKAGPSKKAKAKAAAALKEKEAPKTEEAKIETPKEVELEGAKTTEVSEKIEPVVETKEVPATDIAEASAEDTKPVEK